MKGFKQRLPVKICASCKKPFQWRKKWRNCWEVVRYCSERCRRGRRKESAILSGE